MLPFYPMSMLPQAKINDFTVSSGCQKRAKVRKIIHKQEKVSRNYSITISALQYLINSLVKINLPTPYYSRCTTGIYNGSFIIQHIQSTIKINTVHERSLWIIRNDYESLYPLLLEETHQITFHHSYDRSL